MWTNIKTSSPRIARLALASGLIVLLAGSSGCQAIKTIAAMTAPTSEKVPAEYNRLSGKAVLVYVWAPPEVLWDYPKLRLDVAAYVGAYLSKNVEKVTMIDPLRVEATLERGNSLEADPVELGKQFAADAVIHLAIYQFSLRDQGYSQFFRGRISSSVVVYDMARHGDAPERVPLRDVRVAVPDEKAVGYVNVRADQVRQQTYDTFAVEVGKKFHEWERPLD